MQAATAGIAQSQANLEKVSSVAAASQARSLASVAAAERRLAEVVRTSNASYLAAKTRRAAVEDAVARQTIAAEIRVQQAQARVAAAAQSSSVARQRAALSLAAAERNLENVQVTGATRIIAAQKAVESAYTSKVARIAAAEAAVAAAQRTASNAAAEAAARQAAATTVVSTAVQRQNALLTLNATILAAWTRVTRAATAAQAALGRALIAVTGFSNRLGVSLRFGIVALTAFSAAFAIGAASSFETTLARIDVLTDATTQDVAFLSDEIKQLAAVVPQSPNELGATAYFVLSSGIKDLNEALAITELAAKASTIGLGEAQDVARTVTSVINAYGKENISAAQATDILVAAVQQGSAEASDFAGGLGRLLGIAPTLGIQFDQLAANVAALTNAGLESNQATTAMLGILNQIISPSKDAQDTLEQFGTSIEEVRRNIREKGLNAAMADLIKNFEGNVQAFENLFPEVRGLTGALIVFAQQAEEADSILNTIRNSAGITEQGFQQMTETFDVQAGLLKNQLNLLLIDLGEKILPAVTQKLQDVVKFLQDNEEAVRNLVVEIVDFTTTVIGNFIRGLTTVNSLLSFIPNNAKVIILAISAIGIAMATAFGPKSAALAGLILIIGSLKEIKNFGQSFANTINDFLGLSSPEERDKLDAVVKQAAGSSTTQQQFRESLEAADITGPLADELVKEFSNIRTRLSESEDLDLSKQLDKALGELNLDKLETDLTDTELASDSALTVVDALADGIIDFAEAVELGIDAVQAGALEASVAFRAEEEAAFEFTKTLSRVANAFKDSEEAAQKLVLALAKEALAKVRAAQQALFGAPTREVAELQLQLAELDKRRAEAEARIIPQLESAQDQLDALKRLESKTKEGREATEDPIIAEVIQKGLDQNAIKVEGFTDGLDGAIEALENQIAGYERELELLDREAGAIQRRVAIYEAESAILQAQILLADKTLETQESQRRKALELIDAMGIASESVVDLAGKIGEDTIDEFNELSRAFDLLQKSLGILENEDERAGFIRAIGEAEKSADDFAEGLDESLATIEESVQDFLKASGPGAEFPTASQDVDRLNDEIAKAVQDFERASADIVSTSTSEDRVLLEVLRELRGNSRGSLITSPTVSMLGEGGRPELVLPLSDPNRSQELIRSLPAHLSQGIFGSRSSPSSIFGDLNVSGSTMEQMRLLARAEMDKVFRQNSRSFRRAGL